VSALPDPVFSNLRLSETESSDAGNAKFTIDNFPDPDLLLDMIDVGDIPALIHISYCEQ
jgi:hypothetical protein